MYNAINAGRATAATAMAIQGWANVTRGFYGDDTPRDHAADIGTSLGSVSMMFCSTSSVVMPSASPSKLSRQR